MQEETKKAIKGSIVAVGLSTTAFYISEKAKEDAEKHDSKWLKAISKVAKVAGTIIPAVFLGKSLAPIVILSVTCETDNKKK